MSVPETNSQTFIWYGLHFFSSLQLNYNPNGDDPAELVDNFLSLQLINLI
jgi:hypothetical protein